MAQSEIGINWSLRYRKQLWSLRSRLDQLEAQNKIMKRKLKKYENNNTGSTSNRKNNNVDEFSGRVYPRRNTS